MQTLRARCCSLAFLFLAAVTAAQREAVSTRAKLDFTPFAGTWKQRAELVPVLAGDSVLVTSTQRLFAFDARTAELRWSAGPPDGWDGLDHPARVQLYSGVDARQWIAPAAGGEVAVAAFQLPLSRQAGEELQGLQITTPIPERRLFAFDLRTGRPLWNHAPPRDWDGASGSFAQRMSLCSSPTIVSGCVLVPCASDASSVDYHVAGYELTTGALLWSTFVVRGQVERNSFGKAVREFAGAPLVGVPGRGLVLAQTGLGQVAALDLATGRVLWRTEYTPIELPKVRSYTPPMRETVWRTTPPIVAGDVVLVTPRDSRDLLALDLADGHVLWSFRSSALDALDAGTSELAFDHLIGAGENVLYLGGAKLSALAKPGGLRSTEPPVPLWTARVERPETAGRAQLARDGVVFRGSYGCPVILERERGRVLARQALDATRGMLVTDEELFVLADDGLTRVER